jgi:predicted membrane-bound dolichyl-phosphate-mannose-protein mannosyltransferase
MACTSQYAGISAARAVFPTSAAIVGGLLFALHPVHVEAVANIVGRAEMIAASFFFTACLIWCAKGLSRWTRVLLASVCYVLAMFAKESAVVLPAILFLLDSAQDEKPRWTDYGIVSIAFVVFMLCRWQVVGGLAPARLDPSIEVAHGWFQRTLTALLAWPSRAGLLRSRARFSLNTARILMPF